MGKIVEVRFFDHLYFQDDLRPEKPPLCFAVGKLSAVRQVDGHPYLELVTWQEEGRRISGYQIMQSCILSIKPLDGLGGNGTE